MATISLCMIIKNEERLLKRCLDSVCDLVDEIVIVDTGSSDSSRDIALNYTDKVYDFTWINDFSAARNFSFSKCSMDYIYVADADEYLDEANRTQFKLLKDNLYPEIEIVQMMYETISHDTVLNINREYRPKLFKRLREFVWINPVHETVRLDPLVFDSDIVITHAPESNHAKRDFSIFEDTIAKGRGLSDELIKMYATELYKNGNKDDFDKASGYFINLLKSSLDLSNTSALTDILEISGREDFYIEDVYGLIIISKWLRLIKASCFEDFVTLVGDKIEWPSELSFELGLYYLDNLVYDKAYKAFRNAFNANCYLDIHSAGDTALKGLINSCEKLILQYEDYKKANGNDEKMDSLVAEYKAILDKYKIELNNWKAPEQEVQ